MTSIQELFGPYDAAALAEELQLEPEWALAEAERHAAVAPWHNGFDAAAAGIAGGLWRPGAIASAFALAVVLPGVLWAIAAGLGFARLF